MNYWPNHWFGFWCESPEHPGAPSIKDWVSPGWCPASEKRRFVDFLSDGIVLSVATARFPECPVCGTIVDRSLAFLTDGYWIWSNYLIHQVEVHEVVLPDVFVQHIGRQNYTVTPPQVADEEALIRSLDWSMCLSDSPRSTPRG
jgi:hypothetical protein